MHRVVLVAGARPNFMKIAPIVDAMVESGDFEPILVHTGQHYDAQMSRVFFDELGIREPDINLGVGSAPRAEQIATIEQQFGLVLDEVQPRLTLVVGDVNSTVACARASSDRAIQVAHVEAGLRSFDESMPEELNRVETDRLSDLLFVTEPSGLENLEREQVAGVAVLVGNVMIDSLIRHLPAARARPVVDQLGLEERGYLVATLHRPSNVDTPERLRAIMDLMRSLCAQLPVVAPLHPRTRVSLERFGLWSEWQRIDGLVHQPPLGYLDFLALVDRSAAVLTDSGGVQEETTWLGIPCVTMRDNTERPATITHGTNVLAGTDTGKVHAHVMRILEGERPPPRRPELWDGAAAQRIVRELAVRLD